jgi:hypothetical protein
MGDAQQDPLLEREVQARLVGPARAQHRTLLADAQQAGALRDDADLDLVADSIFGPIWFRLLVTKAPLSSAYAEEVARNVLSAWTSPATTSPRRTSRRTKA